MIQSVLGIIDKMRIEVFDTKDLTVPPKKTIFVQLNPEKYTMKHNVVFYEGQAIGSTSSDLQFNKIEPEEVSFDFVFDSSGVVPPGKIVEGAAGVGLSLSDITDSISPTFINPLTEVESVEKQVEGFRKAIMEYNGDQHQTPFLKLLWGGYNLSCRLKSMDIEFSLFRKDGRPIRAKAKCIFKGTVEYKLMLAEQNNQSPDLTHERIMTMNDRIPLVAEAIYNNKGFYIDVAKANNLLSFRNLTAGQKINFPPIK